MIYLVDAAMHVALILRATCGQSGRLLLNDLNISIRRHNEVLDCLAFVQRYSAGRPHSFLRGVQSRELLELHLVERIGLGSRVASLDLHRVVQVYTWPAATSFDTLAYNVIVLFSAGARGICLIGHEMDWICRD